MSKILKQLVQNSNEDLKYKQVLEVLYEALEADLPLFLESSTGHKDYAIFITNLLVFNFEKIDNSHALIAGLRKLTEKTIDTCDSPSLLSELINELENKYLESKLLASRENILYFLSEITRVNAKTQFMKKSQANRIFEFFKTSFSFTQQTKLQHTFTLKGLIGISPLAELDQFAISTILGNMRKLGSEYDDDFSMSELIAKVVRVLATEATRINNRVVLQEIEHFIALVF